MRAPLTENYKEAALRHWDDAEYLKTHRIAAADHHVGLAAECAIKAAMGISVKKKHVDKLWSEASTVLDTALYPLLITRLGGPSPFEHWQIDDRYAETTALEADIAVVHNGVSRGQARYDATAEILRETGLKP